MTRLWVIKYYNQMGLAYILIVYSISQVCPLTKLTCPHLKDFQMETLDLNMQDIQWRQAIEEPHLDQFAIPIQPGLLGRT